MCPGDTKLLNQYIYSVKKHDELEGKQKELRTDNIDCEEHGDKSGTKVLDI